MPINQYKGRIVSATQVTPQTYGASGEWSLNQQFQAAGSGTWPLQPLAISRSLRFNPADTTYLSRTPASASNRRTYTISFWAKRSTITSASSQYAVIGAGASTYDNIGFYADAIQIFFNNGISAELLTTQVFRDASAWYHIIIAVDTTQATSSNRIKLYVNGTQVTAFSTSTYPTQNYDTQFNTAEIHRIGTNTIATTRNFSGYLTEFNFIDGQALTPSSFGFFDLNGIWQAKTYTGTYGTNGFYLTFADNSNTTATTLGKDYSGNGNNWTPNNFSVAAGAGNDSLIDSPTNDLVNTDTGVGGEVRGNYCTMNPTIAASLGVSSTLLTLTDGNLFVRSTAPSNGIGWGTIPMSSGKWYWEFTLTEKVTYDAYLGITLASRTALTYNTPDYCYISNGNKRALSASAVAYGATWGVNNVIGVAFDADAATLTFYKDNSSQGTAFTSIPSGAYVPSIYMDNNNTQVAGAFNFGQRPFAYTAPSGYKALCSTNLPSPTILNGAQYFAASTYTGNGATQTINNGGNNNALTTFAPDFVWLKNRSGTENHQVFDIIRGASNSLYPNLTNAAGTDPGVTAFNSNGFSLGGTSNTNANNYIAWQWKAGGTAVTNTAGSITSSVSANTTAGFSIVTYTGTGSAATVGHGLGVAPSMIIVRNRSVVENWPVYHKSLTASGRILLNTTGAYAASSSQWNNTEPTSSVFTVNTDTGTNGNGNNLVAYCFAAVSGFSAFGSYTGNGSTDGPFVYTGFRPRYVMMKSSSGAYNWIVIDSSRDTYNVSGAKLAPNLSGAENNASIGGSTVNTIDILSNGFKCKTGDGDTNLNATTYIYACFAENPFKVSRAR